MFRSAFFILVLSISVSIQFAVLPASAQSGSGEIEWRVKDRFRLFDEATRENAEAREAINGLLDALRQDGEIKSFENYYDQFLDVLSNGGKVNSFGAALRRSNFVQPKKDPETDDWMVQTIPAVSAASIAADDSQKDEIKTHVGSYKRRYLYPDSYFIEVRINNRPGQNCSWTAVSLNIGDEQSRESRVGACDAWTSLKVAGGQAVSHDDWTAKARISVAVGESAVQGQNRTIDISFKDTLVVALGDSFISGEGNPDVPSKITDKPSKVFRNSKWPKKLVKKKAVDPEFVLQEAEWWDTMCHRSLLSWPVLTTFMHAAQNQHEAITLVHFGCSGATGPELYEVPQPDVPGGGDLEKPQLDMLEDLINDIPDGSVKRGIDTTLLSIGGNDVGFAGVIAALALPPNGYAFAPPFVRKIIAKEATAACPYKNVTYKDPHRKMVNIGRICNGRTYNAQAALEKLPNNFKALRKRFRQVGISDRVYHAQYPEILIGRDNRPCDSSPVPWPYETQAYERQDPSGFPDDIVWPPEETFDGQPVVYFKNQGPIVPWYDQARAKLDAIYNAKPKTRRKKPRRIRLDPVSHDWDLFARRGATLNYPQSGFEALMSQLAWYLSFRYDSWNFELSYWPEGEEKGLTYDVANPFEGPPLLKDAPKVRCDKETDPRDSEICMALWMSNKLRERVKAAATAAKTESAPNFWTVFDEHVSESRGKGLCVGNTNYPLAMPRTYKHKGRSVEKWQWLPENDPRYQLALDHVSCAGETKESPKKACYPAGRKPSDFKPYGKDNRRFFRVANDAALTQYTTYKGKPRFIHGMVHPTYRMHLEYAQAAYQHVFAAAR